MSMDDQTIELNQEHLSSIMKISGETSPEVVNGLQPYDGSTLVPLDRLNDLQARLSEPLVAFSADLQCVIDVHASLRITSPAGFEKWGVALTKVKGAAKRLEASRLAITRPLDAEKSTIMLLFEPTLDKIGKVVAIIETALVLFAEQAKASKRQRDAEVARSQRAVRESSALTHAAQLEASGRPAEAQQVLDLAVYARTPTVETPDLTPKVRGISVTDKIRHQISDPQQLIKDCLEALDSAIQMLSDPERVTEARDSVVYARDLFRDNAVFLELNAKRVAERVGALGLRTAIPGVDVYEDTGISSRADRG
jgi:hypothetical protein